jgi:DNA-binding MarR family transcriptional regulator
MAQTKTLDRATELLFEVTLAFKRTIVLAASAEDLSAPQATLLWELQPGKPVSMGFLADALACDAANVTGLAKVLERRGLVVRSSAKEDRRVKLLTTTRRGERVRERLFGEILAPPGWLAALGKKDLDTIRSVLERAKGLAGGARLDAADEGDGAKRVTRRSAAGRAAPGRSRGRA